MATKQVTFTSLRLPARWRPDIEDLRGVLSRNVQLLALASSVSNAKAIRYVAATGARDVIAGAREQAAWRTALQQARTGPFDWSVAVSFAFLENRVSLARQKFGQGALGFDDATILRALIKLGERRLKIQAGLGGGVGPP